MNSILCVAFLGACLFSAKGFAEERNDMLTCRQKEGVSDLCTFEGSGNQVLLKEAIAIPGEVFIDYDLTSCRRKSSRPSTIKVHSKTMSGNLESFLIYSTKNTLGPFDNTGDILIIDTAPKTTQAEAFNGECSMKLTIRDETFRLLEEKTNSIIDRYNKDKDQHEEALLRSQAIMFQSAGSKDGLFCLIKRYRDQKRFPELVNALTGFFNSQYDEDLDVYPGICPVVVDIKEMMSACSPIDFSQFCINYRAYAPERAWFETMRDSLQADLDRYKSLRLVEPKKLIDIKAEADGVLTADDGRIVSE